MTVAPDELDAGAVEELLFTFRVGDGGIEPGGGLEIDFYAWNLLGAAEALWSAPQSFNPGGEGYVSASLPGTPLYVGVEKGRRVRVVVRSGRAEPGDTIHLTYRGRVQTLARPLVFHVRWKSRPFSEWHRLPPESSPRVEVRPGDAVAVMAVAPADAGVGEAFRLAVVALDEWGNAAEGYRGTVRFVSGDPGAVLPPPHTFAGEDRGIAVLDGVRFSTPGFQRVGVEDGQAGTDDVCAGWTEVHPGTPGPRRRFGETHFHTGAGAGYDSYAWDRAGDHAGNYTRLEETYAYLRDVWRLDFASASEHDDADFDAAAQAAARAVTDAFDEPGRFTTFHAFEWTRRHTYPGGGHRIVLYGSAPGPVFSSGSELTDTQQELFDAVRGTGLPALVIPHPMAAEQGNALWETVAGDLQRVGEIYSLQPCSQSDTFAFEGSVGDDWAYRRAWVTGHLVGVIGSSDNHRGTPGYQNWAALTGHESGGYAAVFSEENTRNGIFEAMRSRRTYATTGVRILLDFSVDGHPLGSEFARPAGTVRIEGEVAGTEALEEVVVFRSTRGGPFEALPVPDDDPRPEVAVFSFDDPNRNDDTVYYLRAVQRDGEAAWGSPVWMEVDRGDALVLDDFEYRDSPLNHGWRIRRGQGELYVDPGRGGRVLRTETEEYPSWRFGIGKAANAAQPILRMHVRDTDDYGVVAVVRAEGGSRFLLVYHPWEGAPWVKKENQLWYPLGAAYRDGTWRELRRDMDADLRNLKPGEVFEKVLEVRLYGDLDADDIVLDW
jgi:hypothetical protein